MIYERTKTIFSAHFNDSATYALWANIERDDMASASDVRALLMGLHGHNFKVQVRVKGLHDAQHHFVVADEDIEAALVKYDGCCLSVLPRFKEDRATTENLAVAIAKDVIEVVLVRPATVTVRVYEADDRWAEHEEYEA